MEIICDCGEEMTLSTLDPDQDCNYVGFDCLECGASLYGTHKFGNDEEDEGDEDEQED